MANKEYFRGCRLEDFTGWGGAGLPTWTSLNMADTGQANKLDTIRMSQGTAIDNGLRGCLWGNFTDPDSGETALLNDFWFTFEYRSSQRDANVWNDGHIGDGWGWGVVDMSDATKYTYTAFVLHSATDKQMLMLRPKWGTNVHAMCITDSIGDISRDIDLGMPTFAPDGAIHRHSIQIKGGGTPNGQINWYMDGNLFGTYSGDLSTFRNFSAISFHGDIGTGRGGYRGWINHYGDFTYVFVTNYKSIRAYLDYRIGSGVQAGGDWQGDPSDFKTYPAQLNTLNGIYATKDNQAVTPTFSKQFTAKAIYYPKSVKTAIGVSSQQLLQGTGVKAELVEAGSPRSMGSLLLGDDGFYRWTSTQDPFAQKDWTTDKLNATDVKITRIYTED